MEKNVMLTPLVPIKPGGPLAGKTFSVTGYSLGSHMATAFNLMHPGVATQVVNFNGAGLGTIGDGSRATMQSQLPQMIQYFADLRDQAGQVTGLEGIFLSSRGQAAYRTLKTALGPKGVPPETADSLHKSRCWRDGDFFTHSINDSTWRQTA